MHTLEETWRNKINESISYRRAVVLLEALLSIDLFQKADVVDIVDDLSSGDPTNLRL